MHTSKIQPLESLDGARFDTPAILKKLAESSRLLAELKGVAVTIPNQVTKQLPTPLYFEDVWVVGLQGVLEGRYIYGVTQLILNYGNAPIWTVDRIQ